MDRPAPLTRAPFRVRFVPGVMPDRWFRTWTVRHPDAPLQGEPISLDDQLTGVRDGTADMAFVRQPCDRTGLHLIPLYTEMPVVAAAREHPVAAFDELALEDLVTEPLWQDPDDLPAWRDGAEPDLVARARRVPPMSVPDALSVVAAGTGILVLPLSLARLHARKDVVHRRVTGLEDSEEAIGRLRLRVGLAWRVDDDNPQLEDFIGIVRGRTPSSTRGQQARSGRRRRRG